MRLADALRRRRRGDAPARPARRRGARRPRVRRVRRARAGDLRPGRGRRPRAPPPASTACSPARSSSTPTPWCCGPPCSPTAGSTSCRRRPTSTLGSIAGRAIGYLAPEVALGGAIVSAGLIETDALDRDGVAAYLNELADNNPELMEHVTSGGGGLLDGLRMRSLLTAGVLAGDQGRLAGQGGLRATGVDAARRRLRRRAARRRRRPGRVGAGRREPRRRPADGDAPAQPRRPDDRARTACTSSVDRAPGRRPAATSPTSPAPTAATAGGCGWSAATTGVRRPRRRAPSSRPSTATPTPT